MKKKKKCVFVCDVTSEEPLCSAARAPLLQKHQREELDWCQGPYGRSESKNWSGGLVGWVGGVGVGGATLAAETVQTRHSSVLRFGRS